MLYLVGLGLSDETDITVKGLEVVKKAERVYLEAYTSILLVDQATLVRCFALPSPYPSPFPLLSSSSFSPLLFLPISPSAPSSETVYSKPMLTTPLLLQ